MIDWQNVDSAISGISEAAARRLSRRSAMLAGLKGVIAATAGLSLGILKNPVTALAGNPGCSWIGGVNNANCPNTGANCPCGTCAPGCPSTCVVCTSSNCSISCPYSDGQWTVGSCGNCGFYYCTDCMCTSCNSYKCTCESGCKCGQCCTPQAVREYLNSVKLAQAS